MTFPEQRHDVHLRRVFFSCSIIICTEAFLVVGIFPPFLVAFVAIANAAGSVFRQFCEWSKVLGSALDLPYKYIANNYWNFDYALNPPSDRPRGNFTYGWTPLFGMMTSCT